MLRRNRKVSKVILLVGRRAGTNEGQKGVTGVLTAGSKQNCRAHPPFCFGAPSLSGCSSFADPGATATRAVPTIWRNVSVSDSGSEAG